MVSMSICRVSPRHVLCFRSFRWKLQLSQNHASTFRYRSPTINSLEHESVLDLGVPQIFEMPRDPKLLASGFRNGM